MYGDECLACCCLLMLSVTETIMTGICTCVDVPVFPSLSRLVLSLLHWWNTFYTIPHVHVYECQEILLCCVAWVLFCQKKSEAKTKKCCKKSCKKKLQNGSQAKHCFPLLTNKAEKR
jgi:hypothetical protein